MTDPFPSTEAAPLTESAAKHLRGLLDQAERDRTQIDRQHSELEKTLASLEIDFERNRAALLAEIDAIDVISAELDVTAHRYRQRLGRDDERAVQERAWNGVPVTGVFTRVLPDPPTPDPNDPLGLNQGSER